MNSEVEPILVTMYARCEFSWDLQLEFSLPGDPYDSKSPGWYYLNQLKVVHWRDADHDEGVVFFQSDLEYHMRFFCDNILFLKVINQIGNTRNQMVKK